MKTVVYNINGMWETWYENGQPQESTMYKDGKPDKAFN